MECNKDEAARAKSIAEAKLENKDFAGAKKFALKAQTLYPRLDGISQMLMTLDVYISAEKRINGQVNWYGVLGVGPTAEDEAIKKQYRKLALMLHPDKNNSVGADGAFKLISEAWGLLSDKAKRSAYNLTTGHKGLQQKIPTTTNYPSPSTVHPTSTSRPSPSNVQPTRTSNPSPLNVHPTSTNSTSSSNVYPGSCNRPGGPPGTSTERVFTKSAKKKQPAAKPQKKTTKAVPAPPKSAPTLRAESFWTICGQCKIQYEYHNMYRNTTLLCTNCKMPFVALTIPRPVTKSKLPRPSAGIPVQQQQKQSTSAGNHISNSHAPSSNNNVRGKNVVPAAQKSGVGQAVPKFPMRTQQPHPTPSTNVISAARPSVAAKVTIVEDKPKRPLHTESNSGMDGLKKTKLGSHNGGGAYGRNYNSNYKVHDVRKDNSVTTGNTLDAKVHGEPTHLETRKLLMGKARREISRKLNEMSVEMLVDNNNNKRKVNKAEKRQVGPADNIEKGRKSEKLSSSHKKGNGGLSAEINNAVVMNVPDPDFFDFDQDRAVNSFVDNDVWAAYDDDDGMPRLYALIHKVVSKRPFQLKISWLNSKTTAEFSPTLDWVGFGFYKTCGEFRIGKHKLCGFVNAFSQRVKWSKGPRGTILIFPQKGDVWALYRNWSPNWDMQTPDDVIHRYDMVMVLDGYDEEKGLVSVSPLVKVAGFRTVFCPDIRKEAVVEIQREEMFRFSHRVPHHALTSQEAPGAPDGCVELDPAATPLELLGIGAGSDAGTVVNESAGVKVA